MSMKIMGKRKVEPHFKKIQIEKYLFCNFQMRLQKQ